jgi:pyruvate dehydrogenase E2 component (dihydrolipoamide acetyltransferase)
MNKEIRMPDVGTVENQVKLVRWLKAVGESVELGEPLFEVETDKGVIAIESVAAGTILQLVCPEGSVTSNGDVIAIVAGREGSNG